MLCCSFGNKARTRAPRTVRCKHVESAFEQERLFRWSAPSARCAWLSHNRLSERVANLFYSHIISMRVARQLRAGEDPTAALMRPSTSSRPSSSAGLVSTSTLLQPLRLASAVLRPLNLPADFEGGDPASSRVVISDAATDDSLNKPASLAPHQVADEPKASGASSLALQAHATHAAQLSELLASTNVSDKPAAASDPSDALDGVLANLQKQRQRIAAQQQAAEQPRPEAPSINPAPAAAAAPSSASADAEQGEAEEEADEEDEEVEEVLFRCFPSHVASLFSAGSAELREMAIDRLSTHLRETAAADDEEEDEEGGGMTSLHAFAAEAELAAANVQAAVQRQEAAADSPEAPPRFWARAAPLDPSDTLLFGSHEDEEEEDDGGGAGGSGAAPTASVADRLHGCCLILREALHDPNLQVMLSALTLLDPEGPLLTNLLPSVSKPECKRAMMKLLKPLRHVMQTSKSYRASQGAMLAIHALITHASAEPKAMMPAVLKPLRVATTTNNPLFAAPPAAASSSGSSSTIASSSTVLASSRDTFDSPNYCCMRLQLAHKLLLHGSTSASSTSSSSSAAATSRRHPILAPVDALPLCADAIRSVDANVRQAAADLLVRVHALGPVGAVEGWLEKQPPMAGDLSEQIREHFAAARTRLLRPSASTSEPSSRASSRPGTALSGGGLSSSRPGTALTLGNLLQRPPTAACLSLPPPAGGVRATLGREGLFDAGISSGSEGPGSMGEEAQILKLE